MALVYVPMLLIKLSFTDFPLAWPIEKGTVTKKEETYENRDYDEY
jgi:hypothetical protein